MGKASIIEQDLNQIMTIEDLTNVFESIASTRIAKIKDKVELSNQFFARLWRIYQALRVDAPGSFRDGAAAGKPATIFVLIAADGGLSGDIDHRLIETVKGDYVAGQTEVMVIGDHGATMLGQQGIPYKYYFKVPHSESYVDVGPILDLLDPYDRIIVYYESYVSLGVQGIKKIDLSLEIDSMGGTVGEGISMTDADTVFEPSREVLLGRIERTIMGLAFSQVILESSLAQDASRFNAMAVAKKLALDMMNDLSLDFHRAKRAESDHRLREIMISLKKKRQRSRNA